MLAAHFWGKGVALARGFSRPVPNTERPSPRNRTDIGKRTKPYLHCPHRIDVIDYRQAPRLWRHDGAGTVSIQTSKAADQLALLDDLYPTGGFHVDQ